MLTPSLEIIFGDLPVKMTSTNEFVPVMKQNIPVIVPYCQKHRIQNMQFMVKIIKYIEITAWLVRVYNFYARVVKDCKPTSERSGQVSLAIFHNKCIMKIVQRTNHPTKSVIFFNRQINILIFFAVQQKIPAKLANDVSTWKEV